MKKLSAQACVAFGQFLLARRRLVKKTARQIAADLGILPSNYSKIETGTAKAPSDPAQLKKLGKSIGLHADDDWYQFRDLAARTQDAVPVDLVEIIGENALVPLFLRTLKQKQITPSELKQIIDTLGTN